MAGHVAKRHCRSVLAPPLMTNVLLHLCPSLSSSSSSLILLPQLWRPQVGTSWCQRLCGLPSKCDSTSFFVGSFACDSVPVISVLTSVQIRHRSNQNLLAVEISPTDQRAHKCHSSADPDSLRDILESSCVISSEGSFPAPLVLSYCP